MERHATGFAVGVICIWLSVWAIRKKAEIDLPLDRASQSLRCSVILLGFAVAHLPGADLGYVRVTGYLVGMVFLCWPNFSYHLAKLFSSKDVVRKSGETE
jgi:hypothetical protein